MSRGRARLGVLVLAQVLGVANASMIAVALPPLADDLGASGTEQQWIVDAYVLVFAALVIPGGVLADRYGRRRALVGGLLLFATGSLACAVASDPGLLVAARVVQGLGPPLILPASLAIVSVSYPDRTARARAIGVWGAGSGVGIAAGPIVGGLLVAGLGWRWVFAANVPIAIALAVAVLVIVAPSDRHGERHPFDVAGAALVTLGLAALVFAIISGGEHGFLSAPALGGFGGAAVLLGALLEVERRHAKPLLNLELLRKPSFAVANLGGAGLMFTLLGATVYLSVFLQERLSALETGLALAPLGIATAITAAASGRLTSRLSPKALSVAGLLLACAASLGLSRIAEGDGPADVWPALVALGAGIGTALPAMTATALAATPSAAAGMASAVHNASRQLGATLGVAVLGTIVLAHATTAAGLRAAMVVAAGLLLLVAGVTYLVGRR